MEIDRVKENYTQQIRIRVTPRQYEMLKQMAEKKKVSMSDLIRDYVLNSLNIDRMAEGQ